MSHPIKRTPKEPATSHPRTIPYRPDIDGLRAVAVVAVLLFHVYPKSVTGGYVGVDVFFVISGYLITNILLRELERGKFSFRNFWMRRVRRLFPALCFVLVPTALVFGAILNPLRLQEFGQSLLSQLVFASNVYFWKTTGYFETASDLKPLLHTWSLAVEEQFYMLFPATLFLVYRFARRWLLPLLLVVCAMSFAISVWSTEEFQSAAFYLLPARAWELGLGAVLAALSRETDRLVKGQRLLSEAMAAVGLVCIFGAVVWFNAFTPFPSYTALLPTAGAALFIAGGVERNWTSRLLSFRPIVFIGKISYSLYLWHWVALVLAKSLASGPLEHWARLTVIAASVGLASISYYFVEQPVRKNKQRFTNKRLLVAAGTAAGAFAAAGLAVEISKGWPERLGVPETAFERSPRRDECLMPGRRDPVFCPVGDSGASPSFVMVGDSHAYSLLPAVERLAVSRGIGGHFAAGMGCLPFKDVHVVRGKEDVRRCEDIRRETFSLLRSGDVKNVILAARWVYYVSDDSPDGRHQPIVKGWDEPRTAEHSRKLFVSALDETLGELDRWGVNVYVVEQIPHHPVDPHDALFRARTLDSDPNRYAVSPEAHAELHHEVRQLFAERENVHLINIDDYLCDKRCLMFTEDGDPLYSDADHLTSLGSRFVAPAFENLFEELAAKQSNSPAG